VGTSSLFYGSAATNIALVAGATSATLSNGYHYANSGNNNGVVTIGSGMTMTGSGGLYHANTNGSLGEQRRDYRRDDEHQPDQFHQQRRTINADDRNDVVCSLPI